MAGKGSRKEFNPVFAENRRARHDYTVLDTVECGVVLTGTEVKSVRSGGVSLAGAYGAVLGGELWLMGADIAAYKFGNRFNHEPKSRRKLLVHAKEVRELRMKTEAKGLTLIPLKVFLRRGRIKVELGVCRGKAQHDKREAIRHRELNRDLRSLAR
ncbi:MAG: SsrA-binding protein SmpB [Kiritimatiellae bacterium]|nr:SsrA-binding protein SmpB [Kiritimatiellia bacterium]